MVKYLVEEQGANIHGTRNMGSSSEMYGFTPLMWAVIRGHVDVVKYLVEEQRADINATDREGRSCLDNAILNANTEVVDYLKLHVSS